MGAGASCWALGVWVVTAGWLVGCRNAGVADAYAQTESAKAPAIRFEPTISPDTARNDPSSAVVIHVAQQGALQTEATAAERSLELARRLASRSVTRAGLSAVSALHPLDGVTRGELVTWLRDSPEKVGPAALGRPNRGMLLNATLFPEGPHWHVVDADRSWGTAESIRSVTRAITEVHRQFDGAPKLYVGDISRKRGGYLRPHRSHQNGCDVDLGYYYSDGEGWYVRATKKTLDVPRTWALIVALIDGGNVEYVFTDASVRALLREHAERTRIDPVLFSLAFGPPGKPKLGVLRHTWGHHTHLHVRFRCESASETGRRIHPLLKQVGKLWR